jgi:hypothetical protein
MFGCLISDLLIAELYFRLRAVNKLRGMSYFYPYNLSMPIHYLQRQQIDAARWDACIAAAENGLVYGTTVYLDNMADRWDGLVLDDYKAVMPLPWRKKWGVYYLYHPAFIAQLGLFGKELSGPMLQDFLRAIPHKFKYADLPLNHGNLFRVEGFNIFQRNNYVLTLQQPYEVLYEQYRENIRRNIKKAAAYGCYSKPDVSIKEIVTLARSQPQQQMVQDRDFENFTGLFQQLKEKGKVKAYGVFSSRGELLASAAFLLDARRAYYILVGNHPNGRTLGASHALIDAFIKDHHSQDLILDFEGSDIRNLAFFYSSFGAKEQPYATLKMNRLPWYARWMKL